MKSLSKNLFKSSWVYVQEDKKSIDNNERVAQMMEKVAQRVEAEKDGETPEGFVQGLAVSELDSLLMDAEELESGNVIKAYEGPSEEELQQQANDILAQARQEAQLIGDQIIAEAKGEADRIREQAREQGYAEGSARAQRELEQGQMQLQQQAEALDREYQEQLEEMEPAIVDVLTDLYEHIFNVELQQYRQILIQLITSTMRKVEENKNFLLHVSKEDYAFVSMNKKTLQESSGSGRVNVEIVEDMTLSKNQCMLETENGIFDCGLDTQLAEITRKVRLLSYERKNE